MRVLGTTKLRARAILSLEQATLCLAGLVIGIIAALPLNRIEPWRLDGLPLPFALLYLLAIALCGVVCSAMATRKPPLELLQVRE